MKSVKNICEYRSIIKKSTFICTLIPCDNIDEANIIINDYQQKYHDATHNCVAYVIGSHQKADDDGEPSGTAGLPMLNVLTRQGLDNIVAIVTRYFGGIKLGAGGLTRAYTNSVADALKEATIVEKNLVKLFDIGIDYSFTKKMDNLLKQYNIDCINKEYLNNVIYRCYIEDETFFDIIREYTSNNYTKEFIKESYIESK